MRHMRKVLVAVLFAVFTLGAAAQSGGPTVRPYFTDPSISPDRAEIAFISGGDIWAVPSGGGEARLLLSHPANESRPMYSPDGRRLAFVSTRTGGGDIYLLTFTTGAGSTSRRPAMTSQA
jgi:Tol biopolymer transport system component